MSLSIGPRSLNDQSQQDEDEVLSTINTTPLVDVMLVLLIIFLITIPVVTHTVPVKLPNEIITPTVTKPDNILLSVTVNGDVFWNQTPITSHRDLVEKLKVESVKQPQPEVHIRGDQKTRYEAVGKVVVACQQAGITKVGFITEPPARSSP
jgi:biopolymer transport protein ExbD